MSMSYKSTVPTSVTKGETNLETLGFDFIYSLLSCFFVFDVRLPFLQSLFKEQSFKIYALNEKEVVTGERGP
jgi:hypothetical protein